MKYIKTLERREVGTNGNKVTFAVFECEFCGSINERQLNNGKRDKSCGCIRYKLVSENNEIHGDSASTSKYKNLFGIWARMRDRCNRPTNKDYMYYGGKGIVVEPEWSNYIDFKKWSLLNGYEPKKNLQIDRIDSNKNYCAANCRWVSPKVNQRNRECVKLSVTKAKEIKKLLANNVAIKDIAELYLVHKDTIRDIQKGKTWTDA